MTGSLEGRADWLLLEEYYEIGSRGNSHPNGTRLWNCPGLKNRG